MSPGTDLGNAYLVANSTGYHNRLCALDVLGLEEKPTSHQSDVREEFKEQLTGLVQTADTKLDYPGKGTVLSCPIIVRTVCAE